MTKFKSNTTMNHFIKSYQCVGTPKSLSISRTEHYLVEEKYFPVQFFHFTLNLKKFMLSILTLLFSILSAANKYSIFIFLQKLQHWHFLKYIKIHIRRNHKYSFRNRNHVNGSSSIAMDTFHPS